MATLESAVEMPPWVPAAGPRSGQSSFADGPLGAFEQERSTMTAIAARILGSAEADDVVQEVFIRWQQVNHGLVRNPAAFLARMATRLSINALKAAHRRRIDYVGFFPHEPELSADSAGKDPLAVRELTEHLATALELILERLTPLERAVFLLHECFGYSYTEVAVIVGRTEDNCRQIERRARQHLLLGRGRSRPAESRRREQYLDLFLRASREGEVDQLLEVLAREAAEYSSAISRSRH